MLTVLALSKTAVGHHIQCPSKPANIFRSGRWESVGAELAPLVPSKPESTVHWDRRAIVARHVLFIGRDLCHLGPDGTATHK